MSRRVPRGGPGREWLNEPDDGQARDDQGAQRNGNGAPGQDQQQHQYGQYGGPAGYGQQQPYGGQGGNGPGPQGYDQPGPPPGPGQGNENQPTQTFNHQGRGATYPGNGDPRGHNGCDGGPRGYQEGPVQGNMRRYEDPQRFDGQRYQLPGQGPGGPASPGEPSPEPPTRKVRFRRTRRFFHRRTVRVISAIIALFLLVTMFSAGQAAFKNNGQGMTANLAEWARDHYLGPVVTFGEWLSYNPPPKGGRPSFSLAVPSGEGVAPTKPPKGKTKIKTKQFVPDIPGTLKSLAPSPIAGEGQWRVVEKVKGNPAILTTFLRDATYTSQVNGVASIDQRLVKFSLHPGSEDPGSSPWGWNDTFIPAGKRTGLLATFNGGFKLSSAGGGFYLNGSYHGSLVTGAASVVYYKNGTIKIGKWGRDFSMNAKIAGVRQNLKLIIDHGKISPNLNQDIMTNFGATLGGGYYVWRSGLGITKDGRIVYVYGPALNVQDLAELLHRAGAVEGLQMDINPAWMKFDTYQAKGNPANPTPVTLLPTQQPSAYSYYTASTRDFTAVYAR
ncbi:hypothetical protein EAS64_31655 [Trebonia kvetii]|uniref:Phosphodiester glycosidase domain-containing protein n=1 Tax=Trebonia kvetii TaxID=2480626 RepID=A0A6P2BTG8_9ACTN|nr:phosphodiester glycosidase family protein [Trebonia kvetii]TVZ01987.1 hypothetical protein EAS64_31655 [Trebonia kvetii]